MTHAPILDQLCVNFYFRLFVFFATRASVCSCMHAYFLLCAVTKVAVMRMCDHPNVLSCYASFVHENELWLVMEFMSKGSCLHVMHVARKEVRWPIYCTAFVKPNVEGLTPPIV